jgi:putative flippase GtrA
MAQWNAFIRDSRFLRTAIVGAVATVADLALLIGTVETHWLTQAQANFPSLLLGSAIQFLGNRYWVFHAEERPWGKQLASFAFAEAISFGLNGLSFHLLVAHTPLYYPLARPVSVALVFFLFSYPAWKWIFRKPSPSHPR